MHRVYVLIFFTIMSMLALAQDEIINATVDSLNQQYNNTLHDIKIYEPEYVKTSEEDIIRMIDRLPAFSVYKDNYFVTGIPLNQKITKETADAIFQISIRQRLTKSVLPFNTFLYLTYTQKSFWNLYALSSPFSDINYNPGLGLGKYICHKDRLLGAAFLQIQHESNGRDEEESRSWYYLNMSIKYFLNPKFNISGEFRIPYIDGINNKDLLDYRGRGCISLNYRSNNHKWWLSADINPIKGFGNANTTLSASFKISEKSNQYLYARFFQGYGESLIDYNKYTISFRIGICIRPDFFSMF